MKKFDEFFNEQDNILENKRMDELRKKNAEMTARLPIKGESTKKWMKLKKEYDSLMDQQQKFTEI